MSAFLLKADISQCLIWSEFRPLEKRASRQKTLRLPPSLCGRYALGHGLPRLTCGLDNLYSCSYLKDLKLSQIGVYEKANLQKFIYPKQKSL